MLCNIPDNLWGTDGEISFSSSFWSDDFGVIKTNFWSHWFESCSHCSDGNLSQLLFTSIQVVEELLSRSGALERETAKGIADAAMLEVASISMGHMVCKL